jgi:glycerophosphoryl diester phosphodiesterase
VYTVNTEDQYRQVVAAGVDGLATNYPDRMRALSDQGPFHR